MNLPLTGYKEQNPHKKVTLTNNGIPKGYYTFGQVKGRKPLWGIGAKPRKKTARANTQNKTKGEKIMIFYRNYPYAPKATIFSVLMSCLALISAIGAVVMFTMMNNNVILVIPALLFIALALFFFFYLSHTVADKMAEKETEKNIKKSANYALMYCQQHPDMYETLLEENPKFAEAMKNNASYALQYCKAHPEMYEKLAAENFKFGAKYILNDEGKVVKNK